LLGAVLGEAGGAKLGTGGGREAGTLRLEGDMGGLELGTGGGAEEGVLGTSGGGLCAGGAKGLVDAVTGGAVWSVSKGLVLFLAAAPVRGGRGGGGCELTAGAGGRDALLVGANMGDGASALAAAGGGGGGTGVALATGAVAVDASATGIAMGIAAGRVLEGGAAAAVGLPEWQLSHTLCPWVLWMWVSTLRPLE
jgi:hypothetical protein